MGQKDKLIRKFVLIIISGPSGVGKSEIAKRLSTYRELNSQQLIYSTTRPPRRGEMDGQDYYFVSREEFRKRVVNNQFLNYVKYNNNYYGIPLNSLKKELLTKNVLQIANVEGFRKMKEVEEEIKKRLIIDGRETPFIKEYDHIFTVNDNLDQVAEKIKKKILFSIEQEQHKNQQRSKILQSPPKSP
ncbi:5943_t:CDS:2 [Ambispora gerdemannii]|uniref:5943_t:CDS:1 n=1 Tax=Ambispora gerdemannii TaxID=144530 RepID=A0A9N8V223_9GLOM|nr:5943_t:CDS:2 [Ambispora gerdemannii]